MSSITFPFFAILPCEIRLQIWESAIRPADPDYVGIHTFSIFDSQQVVDKKPRTILPHEKTAGREYFVATVKGRGDDGKTNRSAYLWDAGLWTACWESREVIMSRVSMAQWHEWKRDISNHDKRWESFEIQERLREFRVGMTASSLQDGDGGEDWQLLVRPDRDAFKLDCSNLRPGVVQEYGWGMLDWKQMLKDLPFPPMRGFRWLHDLPESYVELVEELSPRGFFTALVRARSHDRLDVSIWLVDRSARHCEQQDYMEMWAQIREGYGQDVEEHTTCEPRWRWSWEPVEEKTFYNCDEEFVEMCGAWMLTQAVFDLTSAAHFALCKLHKLEFHASLGPRFWSPDLRGPLSVGRYVHVLCPKSSVGLRTLGNVIVWWS
ncbi:hypothetical protein AK830_g10171 [Neonectria ditissima]|uniref:2EXR domain-containing protein n=1 Tax=Neonectria ditissima TaxID=78410 RepID=A0A0P7AGB3_9HYPO|nr:hypothetical protein AK830_g10171 [Neonectria ditissima]